MAKTYRLGAMRRLVNRIVTRRIRTGKPVGGADVRLLTTVGRKTGVDRTNPVTIVAVAGFEWLVAPYGPVSWVHNLRAMDAATLATAEGTIKFRPIEVGPGEAAPVLKHYVTEVRVVRPFFDVTHDDDVASFAAAAPDKPVFRIEAI